MVYGATSPASNNYAIGVNLVRGSTSIFIGNSRGSASRVTMGQINQSNQLSQIGISYLDSPSTTSAVTYKLQMASESGNTATFGGTSPSSSSNYFNIPGSIILMEIGA